MLQLKQCGIQNVLALRGDPPKGQATFQAVEGGFASALDLVKYIRQAAWRQDTPISINIELALLLSAAIQPKDCRS